MSSRFDGHVICLQRVEHSSLLSSSNHLSWSAHIHFADEVEYNKDTGSNINKPRRRSSVSFAPLPPRLNRSASLPSCLNEMDNRKDDRRSAAHLKSKGFRSDYSLGDTARKPSHMIMKSSPELAYQAVNSLQKHDFAFIKRSDGSYSYAILAFRSLEPKNPKKKRSSSPSDTIPLEEYMAFVIDGSGSVKMLKKRKWVEHIRLPSPSGLDRNLRTGAKRKHGKTTLKQKKKNEGTMEEWSPPSIISFVPTSLRDDDEDSANSLC